MTKSRGLSKYYLPTRIVFCVCAEDSKVVVGATGRVGTKTLVDCTSQNTSRLNSRAALPKRVLHLHLQAV